MKLVLIPALAIGLGAQAAWAAQPLSDLPDARNLAQAARENQAGGKEEEKEQDAAVWKHPEAATYRLKLRTLAAMRWQRYRLQIPQGTPSGRVVMKVRLKRDGAVEDIECVQGREHREVAAAAKKLLKELNGQFKPFSASLREKAGDMLVDQVAFTHF